MSLGIEEDYLFERLSDDIAGATRSAYLKKAQILRERLFKWQLELINDPHRKKSVLCPRRAGKSYALICYALITALEKPGARICFGTLTRTSARRIAWTGEEGLVNLCKELELDAHVHHTNLEITLPNGSSIWLTGCQTMSEIEKIRGLKFDLFILDECKSFAPAVIQYLIREVVQPTLNDRLGTMVLAGTPGHILAGEFYQATSPDIPARLGEEKPPVRTWRKRGLWKKGRPFLWSFHTWTVKENEKMPHIWDAMLADKEAYGWADDNPIWMRESLGKWVSADSLRVYRFDPNRNTYWPEEESEYKGGLPKEGGPYRYLMGVDLGFEDDFALVVLAYGEYSNKLYEVETFKSPHMTVSAMADCIRLHRERYECEVIVADTGGLGKAIVETINEKYGMGILSAEKTAKRDYIEMVNSDLVDGRFLLKPESLLGEEMTYLHWKDERKLNEDPSLANHACDAALYVWRFAQHYFARAHKTVTPYGTDAWLKEQEDKALADYMEEARLDREMDWLERLADD